MLVQTDISLKEYIYSAEDKILWRHATQDLVNTLHKCREIIHPKYFTGLQKLGLSYSEPPTLFELNEKLALIGWRTCLTDKFVFAEEFARLQKQKIIPVKASIRGKKNQSHAVSPDLIHSIFGHLPLLFWEPYRDFVEKWSTAIIKSPVNNLDRELHSLNSKLISLKEENSISSQNVEALELLIQEKRQEVNNISSQFALLDMLYVRSLEFGILGCSVSPKIIGAAILSSKNEILNIFHKKIPLLKFSYACLRENIEYIKPQQRFYVTQEISDYFQFITGLKLK